MKWNVSLLGPYICFIVSLNLIIFYKKQTNFHFWVTVADSKTLVLDNLFKDKTKLAVSYESLREARCSSCTDNKNLTIVLNFKLLGLNSGNHIIKVIKCD